MINWITRKRYQDKKLLENIRKYEEKKLLCTTHNKVKVYGIWYK